jgi:24-methylenesterol C-methyltransferase
MPLLERASEALAERLPEGAKAHASTIIVVAGASVGFYTLRKLTRKIYRTNPFKFGNTGALAPDAIKDGISSYDAFFAQSKGKGIEDNQVAGKAKSNTPEFVDKFYSLITDFYEYGWGQSFHFSPRNRGESFDASIKRYEVNISKAIELKEGMKALDLGCGVGGPMRTIAAASGAHVTGITTNDYQVKRATEHNVAAGLATRCTVVQGNFLALPFAPATFDGAYCIEAACHAPKLVELYAQVFKALKPGAKFASYEWLKTPMYDANNPAHVRVVDGVAEGNALPDVRDLADVLAAAKAVGFTVVNCTDAALGAEIPWHAAMKSARMFSYITHYTTALLELIGWAPAGTAAVHKMLINAALDLEESGRLGVFTPMYLCVFQKPL